MSALPVEAQIVQALLEAKFGDGPVEHITRRTVVEALAPAVMPILNRAIAAELRLFADAYAATTAADHRGWSVLDRAMNGVANELRARADELEAGA